MAAAYYNDNDPYVAAWLHNLIAANLIPPGRVDDRNIRDVTPEDTSPQSHFFAGVAGWPLALALAGYPATPVWTASCPCQPFSVAGRAGNLGDERHLWPVLLALVADQHPPVIFGEQVASKDGRYWLAGVRADLEALGYAVGAADLCAASAGAPHIRQRLFWVADAGRERREHHRLYVAGTSREDQDERYQRKRLRADVGNGSNAGGLGNANPNGLSPRRQATMPMGYGRAAVTDGNNPWSTAVWLPCLDGKARRIEPGTFPLAHGVPARVGRLRAYGNAIVPQVAATFVRAYLETRS